MAILVSNLPTQATDTDLSNLFTKYGKVRKIFIFPPAGKATVEMEGEAQEDRALRELNHVEWLGQKLELFKSAKIDDGSSYQQGVTRDGEGGP